MSRLCDVILGEVRESNLYKEKPREPRWFARLLHFVVQIRLT